MEKKSCGPSFWSLAAIKLSPVVFGVFVLTAVIRQAAAADASLLVGVIFSTSMSIIAWASSVFLIPQLAPMFSRAGLSGKDMNKRGTPAGDVAIPESLGLVVGTIYIVVLCVLMGAHPKSENGEIGYEARLFTASLASVTFMVLLGFADDVLDLKWRYNLVLPLVASMPLLMNYNGSTSVVVPKPLSSIVGSTAKYLGIGGLVAGSNGRLVDIGIAYYIYMALLSIFCTNSINIYAGINGLEAGQSFIIAGFILLLNAENLNPSGPKDNMNVLRLHHAFSIDLIMPFAAVTLGLLRYNWYPSSVFVGDTFCYFAGMSFAMASILGHYSETLLLFFVPQLINFMYSLPQLLGFVECPRHRLPHFNKATGKMEAVSSNLTLINLVLRMTGPLSEPVLCALLLGFQGFCCSLGLVLRYAALRYLAGI